MAQPSQKNRLRRFVKAFGPPILFLASSVIFFLGYNTYLIDSSLERLQASLEVSTETKTIEESRLVASLLNESIMEELTKPKLDVVRIASLEFSKTVSQTGQFNAEVKAIQGQVAGLVSERQKERTGLLWSLDRMNRRVMRFAVTARAWLAGLFAPRLEPHVESPLLAEAIEHEKRWELREAIERYQEFLAEYPRDEAQGQIRLKIGYCYHRLGQLDQANALYKLVARQARRRREQMLAQELLRRLQDLKPLIGQQEQLSERLSWVTGREEQQQLLYQLGLVRMQLFNLADARQQFEQAIGLDPKSPIALKAQFTVAWLYKMQEQLDESLRLFESLGAVGEADLAVTSQYLMGDIYDRLGQYEEAIATFQNLSQTVTESEMIFLTKYRVGYTYLFGLQDPAAAKKVFGELGKEFAGNELIEAFEGEVMPGMLKELTKQGLAWVRRGAYEVANANFRKVLAVAPEDLFAKTGVATYVAYTEGMEQGVAEVSQVIEANPKFFFAFAMLGYLQEQQGKLKEASGSYQQAIALEPDYVDVRFNLGYILYQQGEVDQALEQYLDIIKLAPYWAEPYNNVGCLYWLKKRYDEAGRYFEETVRRRRDLAEAHFNVGLYYRLTGKRLQAIRSFEECLKLKPGLGEAKRNLDELREEFLEQERQGRK